MQKIPMAEPVALVGLLEAALACSGPVELGAYGDSAPVEQRYSSALLLLSGRFGVPDWPCEDCDWPQALGLSEATTLAIWDFDYYQLSLRIDGAHVLVERHEKR